MNLPQQRSSVTATDLTWHSLYLAGAFSSAVFVVLNIAAIVLDFSAPPPVSGGTATLEFIASHRLNYILEQALWLIPGFFAMIVFVAIYPALAPVSPSYAALGALIGASAWALTLAIPTTSRGAPALVYLSDQYTATADMVQRTAFATAAEVLIAQNNTPTIAGVLTPVGMLIIACVMVKGVFPKGIAYLGIATGGLGILCEMLRFVLPGVYAIYGLLLVLWFITVGRQLYELSRMKVE